MGRFRVSMNDVGFAGMGYCFRAAVKAIAKKSNEHGKKRLLFCTPLRRR